MIITPLTPDNHVLLDPDILWNGRVGDLCKTAFDAPVNPSGFRAEQAIATAVLICLQTDIRVDESELRDGEQNRGWIGDSFDMAPGEVPIGSRLWLLRRRILSEEIEQEAEDYARAALQTLIDQKVFVEVAVVATANMDARQLELTVDATGRNGKQTFHEKYAILWDQLDGISTPLA